MTQPESAAQDATSTAFKHRDAASYDSVTESFDRFTERCTLPVARRMVEWARLAPQSRVLDVGTGTGVVAFEAGRKLAGQGEVLGVDLSEGMLERATRKAEQLGASAVRFQREDAERLSLPDRSFDVVLSLYALFHFPNPGRALQEMFRVLKPGGHIVLAVGSGPPMGSPRWPAYAFARLPLLVNRRLGKWLVAPDLIDHVVDELVPNRSAAEESDLAKTRGSHMSAKALPSLFAESGFVGLETDVQAHLETLEDSATFWELQSTFSSKARKRLQDASAEDRKRVRAEFDARCNKVTSSGGRLVYPYAAYIVRARRPL